jgi:hypothetical protein
MYSSNNRSGRRRWTTEQRQQLLARFHQRTLMKQKAVDMIRDRVIIETQAEHLFDCLKEANFDSITRYRRASRVSPDPRQRQPNRRGEPAFSTVIPRKRPLELQPGQRVGQLLERW